MTFTVLVPLDGSPLAERALPFAAHLVSGERGCLVLVHVRPSSHHGMVSDYDPAQDAATLCLAGVAATSCVYHATSHDVPEVLSAAVQEARADLVVMSTHGRGGLSRSIFGSVADRVIRLAGVPVLLVPPACDTSWQEQRPAQLLVPLDGSPLAEEALAPAAWLARQLKVEILLVRVLSPTLHPRYREGKLTLSCADFVEVEDAWRYLSQVADTVRSDGNRVSHWVLVGSSSAAIARAARAEGVDLIVMTTHGRGGLGRFMLGSVADGILRRTGVPVLLVRSETASHPAVGVSPTTAGETGDEAGEAATYATA